MKKTVVKKNLTKLNFLEVFSIKKSKNLIQNKYKNKKYKIKKNKNKL